MMKKLSILVLIATLALGGCSPKKAENDAPSAQVEAASDHSAEASDHAKNEENAKASVTPFAPKHDAVLPTEAEFYKNTDNQFLNYIPNDAALVMASKSSELAEEFYKYYSKKQKQIRNNKYKSLGMEDEDMNAFGAAASSQNMFEDWGIAQKQAAHLLYVDDYAMVTILQLEDSKKAEDMFKNQFEMLKLMLTMNGFQLVGEPAVKKNVTTYTLKSAGFGVESDTFYISTKIDANKMFVVLCRDAALKIDKYFSPAKSPMPVEKLGKVTDKSLGSLFINNHKISRILSLISSFPAIGMMTQMMGIAMNEQCYSDYAWLLTSFPETTVDVRFAENHLSIHGNILIPDNEIKEKLDKIKIKSTNLTSTDDLASLNIQLDFNALYELMNEAAKHIVDQQLKCASLYSFKQFAASFPELFSSSEGKILIESLKGASLSIPDDGKDNGDLAYAGMISTSNAPEVVPVVMKLIGSRSAQKHKYQKDKPSRMDFPIELPLLTLPEGNSILNDGGYYIASDQYDVKQIAELLPEDNSELLSVAISQKAIDKVFKSLIEEEKERAELRKQHRKEMGLQDIVDPPMPMQESGMSIGFARLSASVGLSEDGLGFSLEFVD